MASTFRVKNKSEFWKVVMHEFIHISVVFNLWGQGAVLALPGLAPEAAAVYKIAKEGSAIWIGVAIVLFAYAFVYVWGGMSISWY